MKEMMDLFVETIETIKSKKIIVKSKTQKRKKDTEPTNNILTLLELVKFISKKRIVLEYKKKPFLTKEEFIKQKVKPYGSRHIMTPSHKVISVRYLVNDKIYTFKSLEDKVFLCKESLNLDKSLQNIKIKLLSERIIITKRKSLLKTIDLMMKEDLIILLKEELKIGMTDYKLSKSSKTRLRELTKELLIKDIKKREQSLIEIQNSINSYCIDLGIGTAPSYRHIKKGLQIAINMEYEKYSSEAFRLHNK